MATTDLLTEKDVEILRLAGQFQEGAWTGSMGGHDPDFMKLKNGLGTWWREKAASDPHPFAYCVRHLSKKFPQPDRICAWLKDQALGTTSWRKGNGKMHESAFDSYLPTLADLRNATLCIAESIEDGAGGTGTTAAVQEAASETENPVVKIDFTPAGRIFHRADGTTEGC